MFWPYADFKLLISNEMTRFAMPQREYNEELLISLRTIRI